MLKSGRTGPKRAAAPGRSIPNEIFSEIFNYFQDSAEVESSECTRVLFKLSLVSSSFRAALCPRLFSHLVLDADDKRTTSPNIAFCLALIDGDMHARSLAVHIRTCKIYNWSRRNPGPPKPVTMLVMMFCYEALPWVPNIERLQLSSSDITRGFWRVIGSLPRLNTLKICHVSFRDDIQTEEIDRIAGLQAMSLTISDSQVFSPALLPRPLNLITVTALSELSCNLNTLDILLTGGFIDTLETLTISDRSGICMRSLLRVLPKVPSVHKFKVCSEPFTEGPEALPQDFSTLLPNLRSLTCYHAFLALLAPSRPLVSLNVLDEYSPPLNLSAILRSYGPNATSLGITCLYIPSNIYLTAGGFPHLRKLVVEFPSAWYIARFELGIRGPKTTAGLMKFIIDACDKWAGNPSIQQLRIAIEPGFDPMDLDLAIQHAALSGSLLQKFPALRWFQLGDRIEWERLAVDEAWRVFVPINKRAHIVEQFEAGGPHVRDHDGYLRRLNASNLL